MPTPKHLNSILFVVRLAILTDYLTGVRTLKSVSAQSLCVAAMLGSLNEIMKHEDTPLSWDDERFCDVFVSQICKNIGHSEKQFDRRLSLELQKQSLIVLDNLCQSRCRCFSINVFPINDNPTFGCK